MTSNLSLAGCPPTTPSSNSSKCLKRDSPSSPCYSPSATIFVSSKHSRISLPYANEFAEPSGTSTPADEANIVSAKSTLIVVPSALLIDSWVDEIKSHIRPGTLKVHKYHGQHRQIGRADLIEHDIVLTTYGTIATELRRPQGIPEHINWFRLVLDEAHVIRNWSTKQFKAVSTIPAHIRWCLSGTPIQNSLEDLGALVKFLQVPILKDGNNFNTYTTRKTILTVSASKSNFENLRCLLGSICLRRNEGVLPSYLNRFKEYTYPVDFSEEEKIKYTHLKKRCKRAIDMAVSGHKAKETHQGVLEALLRLRLFCNNGDVPSTGFSPAAAEEALRQMQQSGEAVCGYCSCEVVSLGGYDDPTSAILTKCRQLVCSECIQRYRMDRDEQMFEAADDLDTEEAADRPYPTKLKVLLENIQKHKTNEKSVVFSFWKRTLDIVGKLFEANSVKFLRVDGSLPFAARKAVLSEFQSSTEKTVLLMTLGTGAVGLNSLSIASRLHILEPQWNPSVESQAMGRVLRLGQERPVTIVRYIVNKTVEQVMTMTSQS
ncbi:DNA repair protein rad5 [Macrophomina phaseolina]|uniref:DNA repair protein rad5 n=1 Tax=Macrophomina phaseolina TaxID=35725 RepID=A0ABQ8G4N9_9PEZI|nr:DNA repair protein rad5 [Macrophomina phaseolina]